jgi:hypothetical protein
MHTPYIFGLLLVLEMKRVRVLHVLMAMNLNFFQCMHGRATRPWRQTTWSAYGAWLFYSAALIYRNHLVDSPSKQAC